MQTDDCLATPEELGPVGQEVNPRLPKTWGYAFFAATAVVLGQLVYQYAAPQLVKEVSMDDYVRNCVADYKDVPTVRKLDVAEGFLDSYYRRGDVVLENGPPRRPDASRADRPAVSPQESGAGFSGDQDGARRIRIELEQKDKADDADYVQLGAMAQYVLAASEHFCLCLLSIFSYSIGVLLLLMILALQVKKVVSAM